MRSTGFEVVVVEVVLRQFGGSEVDEHGADAAGVELGAEVGYVGYGGAAEGTAEVAQEDEQDRRGLGEV